MKISFVMPFYRQYDEFVTAFNRNTRYFLQCECEVVIAVDDPTQASKVVCFARNQYLRKGIRSRVIVNDQEHAWRPPCKAINVGVRHAKGEWVAIISPESIIASYDHVFAEVLADEEVCNGKVYTGLLSQIDMKTVLENDFVLGQMWQIGNSVTVGYGFLLTERKHLEAINGFDESRLLYGGDDNDIRHRLKWHGLIPVVLRHLEIYHIAHQAPRRSSGYEPWAHKGVVLNQPDWGRDYSRVAYDWIG